MIEKHRQALANHSLGALVYVIFLVSFLFLSCAFLILHLCFDKPLYERVKHICLVKCEKYMEGRPRICFQLLCNISRFKRH